MKTHNRMETKCVKDKFPFYDFDNLAIKGGTMYVITPPDEYAYMRYGNIELGHCASSDYHRLEGTLLSFLNIVFDSIEEEECTIVKYEPNWVIRKSESPELSLLLDTQGINKRVYGITVSKYDAIVKEFAIASFRYNSFVQFLFPCKQVVATPTDHMDLFLELPMPSPLINRIDLVLRQEENGGTISVSPKEDKGTDDI